MVCTVICCKAQTKLLFLIDCAHTVLYCNQLQLRIKLKNFFRFCFWPVGVSSYPQELKQICSDPNTGSVTFSWRVIECKQVNGILLGYEVKLYYGEETCTERVIESMTTYTILPRRKHKFLLPKAISVAAINEVGVGNHSPPVNIIFPTACKTK